MQKGIKEFIAIENFMAEDQSKRINLCKKYFYHSFTCHNPKEFEYCKMSDETIKRIGALNLIQYLADNRIISYGKAKELSKNIDVIIKKSKFDSCLIHNMAIKESV